MNGAKALLKVGRIHTEIMKRHDGFFVGGVGPVPLVQETPKANTTTSGKSKRSIMVKFGCLKILPFGRLARAGVVKTLLIQRAGLWHAFCTLKKHVPNNTPCEIFMLSCFCARCFLWAVKSHRCTPMKLPYSLEIPLEELNEKGYRRRFFESFDDALIYVALGQWDSDNNGTAHCRGDLMIDYSRAFQDVEVNRPNTVYLTTLSNNDCGQ